MPPKFFGQEIQVTTAGEVRTPQCLQARRPRIYSLGNSSRMARPRLWTHIRRIQEQVVATSSSPLLSGKNNGRRAI